MKSGKTISWPKFDEADFVAKVLVKGLPIDSSVLSALYFSVTAKLAILALF